MRTLFLFFIFITLLSCEQTEENTNFSKGLEYAKKSNYDSAFVYLNASTKRCILDNDKYGLMRNYNIYGKMFFDLGKYPISTEYFFKSYNIAKNIDSLRWVKTTAMNLSESLAKQGEISQAINYISESKYVADNVLKDSASCIPILNNLSSMYLNNNQNKQAIECLNDALSRVKNFSEYKYLGQTLNNIGVYYHNLGIIDSASYYYRESYRLNLENGNVNLIAKSLQNLLTLDGGSKHYKMLEDIQLKLDNNAIHAEISICLAQNQADLNKKYKMLEDAIKLYKSEKYLLGYFNSLDFIIKESIKDERLQIAQKYIDEYSNFNGYRYNLGNIEMLKQQNDIINKKYYDLRAIEEMSNSNKSSMINPEGLNIKLLLILITLNILIYHFYVTKKKNKQIKALIKRISKNFNKR